MIANMDGGVSTRTSGVFTRRLANSPGASLTSDALGQAAGATSRWLLERQTPDGHWVGELEGDTILESEYVLLLAFLGRERSAVCAKACKYLDDNQVPDGGWAIYPGGPVDVSASVKAYFALKLCGMPVDHPTMVRARGLVLDLGGADACNSFTRFYLALLGQISYDDCPSVPPELALLGPRLGFSLAAMSSWTRTILVPLSIMSALKPVRKPLAPRARDRRALPRPTCRSSRDGRGGSSPGRTPSSPSTAPSSWPSACCRRRPAGRPCGPRTAG